MDKFILYEKNYKNKKLKLDKDNNTIPKKDKIVEYKPHQKEDIHYVNKEIKKSTGTFNNDTFIIKEKGDILLNNWIKKQTDPLIIFISEIIPETKISKDMEYFRPLVKTTQTISIEEYRKKKKIGENGVNYLKKLKEKYGNIILKVLWANINISFEH